jgi:hypothetical protein
MNGGKAAQIKTLIEAGQKPKIKKQNILLVKTSLTSTPSHNKVPHYLTNVNRAPLKVLQCRALTSFNTISLSDNYESSNTMPNSPQQATINNIMTDYA